MTEDRFKVGDKVSFYNGIRRVVARVVEDRGRIGVNGRQIFTIEVDVEGDQPSRFELPAERLSRPQAAA